MTEQLSNAALYGKGVFTTLVFADGEPVFWDSHARRLLSHAKAIGIDPPPADAIRERVMTAIGASKLDRGRARASIFDLTDSPFWSDRRDTMSAVEVIVGPHRIGPQNYRLKLSDFDINSRSPLAGLKTCNYLENLLVLQNAKRDGYDEAIRVNELGEVASAACANVLWIKDGAIFTPALDTGCLAGTTREYLVGFFEVEEVNSGPAAVMDADAIVLTSAGIGARRASFGDRIKPNDVADRMIEAVSKVFGV